jgi:hypothetical protein
VLSIGTSSERCTPTKKPTARPSRCHWMGDSVLKQSVISNSMPPSRWANRLSFKDPGTVGARDRRRVG